ncbi:hypothetical protein JHK87_035126 [Glycine soja]|nr:hypothetical protein JHK87_035126 [Glycine soja]
MDREQEEMQSLGLFGFLYEEASKITLSWRKILTQITLKLIIPLSFIFLIHIEVSNLFFSKIRSHTKEMHGTNPNPNLPQYVKLSDKISSELITVSTFQIAYFTFLLIISLLSTSSVAYTIASIYTPEDVTFKKVMNVVPMVWKRFMLAFLFALAFFFLYNFGSMIVICLWANTFGIMSGGGAIFDFIGVIYFIGLAHFTVVVQLTIMTDLHDSWETLAMEKNCKLIKEKVVFLIFTIFAQMVNLVSIMVSSSGKMPILKERRASSVNKTAILLSFLLVTCLFLFGFLLHAVIYFVCKSYYHENVDMPALPDNLEVYGGEYVQLEVNDVQQEQDFII